MNAIKIFLLSLPILLVVDFIWLTLIAKSFYQKHLGFLMRTSLEYPHWLATLMVYIVITLGLILFVLPKIESGLTVMILYGALYGFILYGLYEFTNYALVKDWPIIVVIVDLIWGLTLGVIGSLVVYFVSKLVN